MSDLRGLMVQLHQDQAERLDEIERKLDRLLGEPTQGGEKEPPRSRNLEVPSQLSEKFQSTVFKNGQDVTEFPLRDGLDAFFRYFKEVC